jgi:hypothetical protein
MLRSLATLALLSIPLTGCELLESQIAGGEEALIPEPPTATMAGVALLERPSNNQLASWYCHDAADGSTIAEIGCQSFFGRRPNKPDLKFVFETRFDLGNPNSFPIPLVEILLALNVFEGADQAELGALCVSFCDPANGAECEINREDACRPPDRTVQGVEDLIPTVEDLINIAHDAATGELFEDDNLKFRYIPSADPANCEGASSAAVDGGVGEPASCPGTMQASVRFELGIDATLKILGEVVSDSLDELLTGTSPSFDIPYSALGSLFFDIPVLGRYAVEFGPLEGVWSLD